MNQDEYKDMIDRGLTEGKNLTHWEINFLESLDEQLDRSGRLSEKQRDILQRIYDEKVI